MMQIRRICPEWTCCRLAFALCRASWPFPQTLNWYSPASVDITGRAGTLQLRVWEASICKVCARMDIARSIARHIRAV